VTRILVVDDDPQILRALRIHLSAHRYDVDIAPDGASALRIAAAQRPDLVVLDLGLPDMDGTDVIRGLRGWTRVPIVVLSDRAGIADKVDALDAGADDYVTKPFGVDELLARVRASTRRGDAAEASPQSVQIGRHTVDLANHTVTSTGGPTLRLSPTEWNLLEILLRNPGKLISQRQILQQVWGSRYQRETHHLRRCLAQLRRKLEDDPAHPRQLLTEPGMGYRFLPTSPG
jgi:two-component system, OmpR family, KDP operon response regulator KdpE